MSYGHILQHMQLKILLVVHEALPRIGPFLPRGRHILPINCLDVLLILISCVLNLQDFVSGQGPVTYDGVAGLDNGGIRPDRYVASR